mmetsp:Transcript_7328/g.15274  ORF Transcript_7328/g.15274 Transcript_7328/m.15274 type:complete len:240 (+) Transcript_7328:581-1300(+)
MSRRGVGAFKSQRKSSNERSLESHTVVRGRHGSVLVLVLVQVTTAWSSRAGLSGRHRRMLPDTRAARAPCPHPPAPFRFPSLHRLLASARRRRVGGRAALGLHRLALALVPARLGRHPSDDQVGPHRLLLCGMHVKVAAHVPPRLLDYHLAHPGVSREEGRGVVNLAMRHHPAVLCRVVRRDLLLRVHQDLHLPACNAHGFSMRACVPNDTIRCDAVAARAGAERRPQVLPRWVAESEL